MMFLVMQIQDMNASCIDDSPTLGPCSERTRPLQLDVKVRSIDHVEIGRMLRSDIGVTLVAIDQQGTGQDRTRGLEVDVPPHECLTATIRELLTEIATTTTASPPPTPPHPPTADDVLQSGPLRIDLSTREVSVGGQHVRLTRKEFNLLHHLASRPRQVIRREQLMADIWGHGTAHAAPSRAMRTIDTHVNSLRSKLGCRTWIETVRGIGFRFVGTALGDPAPVASSRHNAVRLPALPSQPHRGDRSLSACEIRPDAEAAFHRKVVDKELQESSRISP